MPTSFARGKTAPDLPPGKALVVEIKKAEMSVEILTENCWCCAAACP